ncbi:hypothetical protein OH768_01220 [Streptomyces sp. NBC_01622]|uniref:hypothetical protein n=1 Tax=Streptomyces sp. NBC_01622 TaxID=2975903 RepID=UPI00386E0796|nr:hypothetical protein OH768_01220 [Streptomyces sp. NBC_01622]
MPYRTSCTANHARTPYREASVVPAYGSPKARPPTQPYTDVISWIEADTGRFARTVLEW